MTRIVVLATGGTISSRTQADGAAVAIDSAADLVQSVGVQSAGVQSVSGTAKVTVEAHDLMRENSFNLKQRDLRLIAERVAAELRRPEVDGIVITHGTDTAEETAMLLDLVHDDDRPVVLTGAQRTSDQDSSDGPRNLQDAIAVAAAPESRKLGVLISFGRAILAARGTFKGDTMSPQPFRTWLTGPIGHVTNGVVTYHATPPQNAPIPLPTKEFDQLRVELIMTYAGAGAKLFDAAATAGAAGIVIAGTGAGNLNRELVSSVRQATEAGTVVALSTRVVSGPVVQIYGNGGGVDALRAGAVPVPHLPYTQARVALALLLTHFPADKAAEGLRQL